MFGGGQSFSNGNSMSNGNSFAGQEGTELLEPPLLFPDPYRRMP